MIYRQNNQTNKQKYVQHIGMECFAFDSVRKSSDTAFSP